mmetsp:Transcript_50918/g.131282  ORF Transcript_50918/g.131282 Transcript_50918/m.131282 type:complete len:505 (+) Transcript_50918:232-1746(+)
MDALGDGWLCGSLLRLRMHLLPLLEHRNLVLEQLDILALGRVPNLDGLLLGDRTSDLFVSLLAGLVPLGYHELQGPLRCADRHAALHQALHHALAFLVGGLRVLSVANSVFRCQGAHGLLHSLNCGCHGCSCVRRLGLLVLRGGGLVPCQHHLEGLCREGLHLTHLAGFIEGVIEEDGMCGVHILGSVRVGVLTFTGHHAELPHIAERGIVLLEDVASRHPPHHLHFLTVHLLPAVRVVRRGLNGHLDALGRLATDRQGLLHSCGTAQLGILVDVNHQRFRQLLRERDEDGARRHLVSKLCHGAHLLLAIAGRKGQAHDRLRGQWLHQRVKLHHEVTLHELEGRLDDALGHLSVLVLAVGCTRQTVQALQRFDAHHLFEGVEEASSHAGLACPTANVEEEPLAGEEGSMLVLHDVQELVDSANIQLAVCQAPDTLHFLLLALGKRLHLDVLGCTAREDLLKQRLPPLEVFIRQGRHRLQLGNLLLCHAARLRCNPILGLPQCDA